MPDLTWWAAREAVLNALVHRDYFLRQSIHIEVHRDRVVVSSPGGFVGGQLSGYSRAEGVRLVRSLRGEGLLEITGRGRGAHYEPSLKLLAGMKRGRRRP